jgi:hypothetical protein
MSLGADFLYDLLPAYFRFRDADEGWPLRALMAALQAQADALHTEIGQLYEDAFIETCSDAAVPRIGELVGVRGLGASPAVVALQRALVANTLAYRRRKGLPATLARAAADATGWVARVVAGVRLLAATSSVRAPQGSSHRLLDVRDQQALDDLGGAFDRVARNAGIGQPPAAAVGTIEPGRPVRVDLDTVLLYVWRLAAYPVTLGGARRVRPGGYTFSPFGVDRPLYRFADPAADAPAEGLAGLSEDAVPAPLERETLGNLLAAPAEPGAPVQVEVLVRRPGRRLEPVPPQGLEVRDLSGWEPPSGDGDGLRAAVDPELGRLTLPLDVVAEEVRVSYAYGFSADLGGGPYARPQPPEAEGAPWEALVVREGGMSLPVLARLFGGAGDRLPLYAEVEEALAAWVEAKAPAGVIRVLDSAGYRLSGRPIDLGHRSLALVAAPGQVPCLHGRLRVRGAGGEKRRGVLVLDGLWIDGGVELGGDLDARVLHSTVWPGARGAPAVAVGDGATTLAVGSSVVGPLAVAAGAHRLAVEDSIVDGGGGAALSGAAGVAEAPGPPAGLARVTAIGGVRLAAVLAESCLFTDPVVVDDTAASRVRRSFLPPGSSVDSDPADEEAAAALVAASGPPRTWFTSLDFAAPGFAQLGPRAPAVVTTGGAEGGEMGAFHLLHQAQRAANLPAILGEYVPWGYQARVLYVT